MQEIHRTFVSLESATGRRQGAGGNPCQGNYFTPADARPTTAVIATHYEVDFSEHYLGELLARRGYGFLGWNTRFRGAGPYFLLDHALIDIGAGVRWLREQGVETVVLLGNSGGASLLAAYQSQAIEPNIRPAPGLPLPDAVGDLPAADLYISLNAHPGRPEVLTNWMDPSVTDEADPLSRDPDLDMFDPRNGPPYDEAFVDAYRAAQRARNDRITSWARDELERLEAGGAFDRLFTVHRVWADLRFLDLSLDPSDREEGCYLGDPRHANFGPFGIGTVNTLRTWLVMWSLEASDCTAEPHLARIREPALAVQSTADKGCFPSDARAIFDGLASDDKRFELVAGDHYLRRPEGARDAVADLIADWLDERTH